MTRGMMHDRDSCAKLTSLKIYKLSHRAQAVGQSVEARTQRMPATQTLKEKENILHISEEQMEMVGPKYVSSLYFSV